MISQRQMSKQVFIGIPLYELGFCFFYKRKLIVLDVYNSEEILYSWKLIFLLVLYKTSVLLSELLYL